jgi:carboxymethylenebutenolidase
MAALDEGPFAASVTRVTLPAPDGAPVEAIHARPDGAASLGVVVHPDIMGVRPLFDDLCRRLATHGFAVCSPEPFARAPKSVFEAEAPEVRMAYVPELDDELQLGDLARAADLLTSSDTVDRVAVMGFCMGGMYAFKAAATGRFARAVSFYGMIRVPEGWGSARLQEPLETAERACPTLAIIGSLDHYTPPADVAALRAAWHDRQDCEVVEYTEAGHGFVHAPERDTHRAVDAADAWGRVLAFLRR